jgi:GNAT superfamily N-acetyltransferase
MAWHPGAEDRPVPAQWQIREGTIEEAFDVCRRVPELATDRDERGFRARLETPSALILVGEAEGRAVAFKAGYDRYRDGSWYSWLGGVVPEFRRVGLAGALLARQEACIAQRGYRRIHVKTRNRFVGMRVLLARSGYHIVAVDAPAADTSTSDLRLVLVKDLAPVAASPA